MIKYAATVSGRNEDWFADTTSSGLNLLSLDGIMHLTGRKG
jgi:hypothetical protein